MADEEQTRGEISLSDIFWRLWKGRGVIILVPLIAAALAALYVGISALSQDRPVTYLINLRNIENQRYPNGTAFSPQDLLVPQVVTELRQRFDIPASANLRNAISVDHDSPIAGGISRIYQQRLSARNLTQAEISALNESYLDELQAAMRSSLRITVDYQAIGVDSNTGLAMAAALPQIWTTVYTTKFRIFSDRRLADLAIARTDENLASSASILAVNTRLDAMRRGLDTLLEDNRLALLQTADGVSPADLQIELAQFETTWFSPIKASVLASTDIVAGSYLAQLRLTISDKRRQVEAHDKALAELRDYKGTAQPPQVAQPPASGDSGSSIQVGESALAEIIRLAKLETFESFIEETLRSRRDLVFEISTLTRELEFAQSSAEAAATTVEFQTQAATFLKEITRDYSALIKAAGDQLRDQSGELYEPAFGPVVTGALLSARSLLIVLIAGMAGGLTAVVGVLLWSSIRPRPVMTFQSR